MLSRQTGNPIGEIYSLINLGLVHLRQDRGPQAEVFLRQSLTLSRDIGDRVAEADALNGLGEVLLAAGHADQALDQHRAALSLSSKTGDKYEQARAHDGLGCGYLAGGDGEATRCHWMRALSLHAGLGTPEAGQIRPARRALSPPQAEFARLSGVRGRPVRFLLHRPPGAVRGGRLRGAW